MLSEARVRLKNEKQVIILEDLDFSWDRKKINEVIGLWKDGKPLSEISRKVNREGDEVFLLLMHLSRCNLINKRAGGVYGEHKSNG